MASYNNPRFPANLPVFGQNYSQNSNFSPNHGGGRPAHPPFQRFTAPSFTHFPSPEVFNVATLVSQPPPFSGFPNMSHNFLSQPPPVNVISPVLTRPPNVAGNVWSQQPQFGLTPFNQGTHYRSNSLAPVQGAASVPAPSFGSSGTSHHQRSQQPFGGSSRTPFGPNLHRPPPTAGGQSPSFASHRHHQSFGPSSSRPQNFFQQKSGKTREFKKLKSWMTKELFAEVKKKNALYLKAKSSDEQSAWQAFRQQRNRVSSLIKEAKVKAGLISRKLKEDNSAEKPFSCDTCDRAFASKDEFHEHNSQHTKCGLGGCTFEAHPKIVAIHKKMQHDTGYASVINKLKDEEEIRKWREERKRRFPTAANVQKRKAEQEEKAARGEVLETKEFGKFKRPRTDATNGDLNASKGTEKRQFKKHNKRKFRDWRSAHYKSHPSFKPVVLDVSSNSDSDSDSHISLKKFPGILAISASENHVPDSAEEAGSRSDISSANNQCNKSQESSSSKPNSLKRHELIENHKDMLSKSDNHVDESMNDSSNRENGEINEANRTLDQSVLEISIHQEPKETPEIIDVSDEDVTIIPPGHTPVNGNDASDDESPMALPILKAPIQENLAVDDGTALTADQDSARKMCQSETSEPVAGDSLGEQRKTNAHVKNGHSQNRHQKKSWINNQANKTVNPGAPPKSSLLEKLLADDIRHERNVVLQCIRHIVNKSFFGVGARS